MPSWGEVLTSVFDSVTSALKVKLVGDSGSSLSTPATVGHGRKTVASAGTAEALNASTACKSVVVTAETDNTGVIVVGGSGVLNTLASRTGTPLNAGESMSLDIGNLSAVFVDASVTGDGVTYTYTV